MKTSPLKYALPIILVLVLFFFSGFNSANQSKYPCLNTSCLESLENVNGKPYLKDTVIVIYTFLACAPCQALAKKVQEKFNKPRYLKRIIFLNNVDNDKDRIQTYLKEKQTPFAYLNTKYSEPEGSYPKICFYGKNGELQKTIEGYGLSVIWEMKKFLK